MSNDFFNASGNPTAQARGLSGIIRSEFSAIAQAFDMLPSRVELDYVTGVTSGIQGQLNSKGAISGQAWTGTHNYTGATITVATQAPGDSSTKAASTAFVAATAFSSALPAQTGNAGKFITTNGSTASWATIDVTPFGNSTSLAQVQAAALCF